jgi:biopolymer transport protein ExbB
MFEVLGMIRQGGWPMIPLAICSLAAVTIIIERILALRRGSIIDPQVTRMMEQYEGEGHAEAALVACQRANGPFARIIEQVLRARKLEHTQVLETMYVTGRSQMGQVERGLTVLEIIAGISPLIGLLGTVLGMVTVFNAITVEGIGNPQVLSDGISKALITTVAGLVVGIPSLAAHSWFSRRAEDLAAEMQDRATGFIFKLHALQTRRGSTRG